MKTILLPGRNCQGIFDASHSGVLVDGRDYYLSFYQAAKEAKRHILICGWQFNTGVRLLRGKDAENYGESAEFLVFLKSLCERNTSLEIYILAWDYNIFFILEREWFQKKIFRRQANPRLFFRLDSSHAVWGSHHQKFVIIDGKIAFLGGEDICADRWDDQRHLPENPDRKNPKNTLYGPYHELQAYVAGPVVNHLTSLFKARWEKAGGGKLDLASSPPEKPPAIGEGVPINSKKVAISRTFPRALVPLSEPVEEIRNLYLDAIASAEKLIYIENQYFSSKAVHRALAEKMFSSVSRLEIVIILPNEQKGFLEEISVGVAQAKILRSLRQIADSMGHSLGIYYIAPPYGKGREPVYIHSKVLIVDDRFLSVGSANFTNRSLGIDSELNLSWEAGHEDEEILRSIRRVRMTLLAEHAGLKGYREIRALRRVEGPANYLNEVADRDSCRLCRHPMATRYENTWIEKFFPTFAIDPEKPIVEERLFQFFGHNAVNWLSKIITLLNAWRHGKKI